jgi:hypothetical protein
VIGSSPVVPTLIDWPLGMTSSTWLDVLLG